MKLLFIQFANSMFLRHEECDGYWDAFYTKNESIGYWRSKHVFEIPKWIAEIDYLLDKNKFDREVFYCSTNILEAIDKINAYKPNYTLFSLMDCNKHFIESIVKLLPNEKFIIGGYNNLFIDYLHSSYNNVLKVDKTEDEANILGVEYRFGTDYSLFEGETVIPRLTLSYGCRNNCKFCIVPHGEIIPVNEKEIYQQVNSFRSLNFKLIYIDDKTFGQCENFTLLSDLKKIILSYNPSFEGFIVQTTSSMLLTKYNIFESIGVKVVEIGMETMNDYILKIYNKPSREKKVIDCVNLCNTNKNIKLILNVIVGFNEETEESYLNTFNFINNNINDIVIGINPAIYTDYTLEECNGEIDFQKSDKIELHRKWWKLINSTIKNKLYGR